MGLEGDEYRGACSQAEFGHFSRYEIDVTRPAIGNHVLIETVPVIGAVGGLVSFHGMPALRHEQGKHSQCQQHDGQSEPLGRAGKSVAEPGDGRADDRRTAQRHQKDRNSPWRRESQRIVGPDHLQQGERHGRKGGDRQDHEKPRTPNHQERDQHKCNFDIDGAI